MGRKIELKRRGTVGVEDGEDAEQKYHLGSIIPWRNGVIWVPGELRGKRYSEYSENSIQMYVKVLVFFAFKTHQYC